MYTIMKIERPNGRSLRPREGIGALESRIRFIQSSRARKARHLRLGVTDGNFAAKRSNERPELKFLQ